MTDRGRVAQAPESAETVFMNDDDLPTTGPVGHHQPQPHHATLRGRHPHYFQGGSGSGGGFPPPPPPPPTSGPPPPPIAGAAAAVGGVINQQGIKNLVHDVQLKRQKEIRDMMKKKREKAVLVDRISRWLFPTSFILLNIVYWALFGDHDLW